MHNTLDCYRFVHRFNQNNETLKLETDPDKRYELEQKLHDNIVSIVKTHEKKKRTLRKQGYSRPLDKKVQTKMKAAGSNILDFIDVSHVKSEFATNPFVEEGVEPDSIPTYCEDCNGHLNYDAHNCTLACIECGKSQVFQSNEINAKEQLWRDTAQAKTKGYSYKRENHMWSWILRIQAKESVTIPTEKLEKIKHEFQKLQLDSTNPTVVTTSRVRQILKSLKMPRYYNNVHLVRYLLCGHRPPQMSEKQENDIMALFNDIVKLYDSLKTRDSIVRSNMLSYSYVLQKELELLGYDEFSQQLTLLKHRERLVEQEHIWKLICEESKTLDQKFTFHQTILS